MDRRSKKRFFREKLEGIKEAPGPETGRGHMVETPEGVGESLLTFIPCQESDLQERL